MRIPFWTPAGTIDLADLKPQDFAAETIGSTLARINRFTGRTTETWSVAAHSVLVERLCPPDLGPWALLHDANAAFLGDFPTPSIDLIGHVTGSPAAAFGITRARGWLDRAIGAAWSVVVRSNSAELLRADRIVLQAEALAFMGITPQGLTRDDHEPFDRAVTYLIELPPSRDWRGARDLWLGRVRHHARLGALTPPEPVTASGTGPDA